MGDGKEFIMIPEEDTCLSTHHHHHHRLTDGCSTAGLGGHVSVGGGRHGVGLRYQAECGLLVVVVVVVHDSQVHGKDGCGGGRHLRGQCCSAHVH